MKLFEKFLDRYLIIESILVENDFFQPGTDYSGDISDFRTALQRLREELDRLKQLIQDLINKGNLTTEDIDVCFNIRLIVDRLNIVFFFSLDIEKTRSTIRSNKS